MSQISGWGCVADGCQTKLPYDNTLGKKPPEIYREYGWMFSANYGNSEPPYWDGHCWCPDHEDEALDALSADD